MNTQLVEQVRGLDIDEQIELDRRRADHRSNPDNVLPWDEVKAAALARIGQ